MAVSIITFGCRLNMCESEIIGGFARELNLEDYTIINTCAVTAEAERKLRQTIRKLHKDDNNVKIILTGCAAELHSDDYMNMDGVIGIISNGVKLSKSSYELYGDEVAHTDVPQEDLQKIRGFLQIQNGCDQKCTYCVVRITRGKSVSFSKDDIVSQAKILVKRGYKEIVLTGVNVSSYGRDTDTKESLAKIIVHLLNNVPEIHRLRLSSLDPADISDELINVIGGEEKLMPHIHESIQSGDDMILKRMLRRHNRSVVIDINHKILSVRPDVVFGADMIVGFPTETDDMFLNSVKLIGEAKISLSHIFPYSKRPGTPAANMPNVEKSIALERAKILRAVAYNSLKNKMHEYIGKSIKIIAEDNIHGRTDTFLSVKSKKKMQSGNAYLYFCDGIDGEFITGDIISLYE